MLEVWADAVAAGVSDELFWRSTPWEVRKLLETLREQEVALEEARMEVARLNAGLITSAVLNVHIPRGRRKFKPSDFVAKRRSRKQKDVSPEEMAQAMYAWAEAVNAKNRAQKN